MLRVGTTVVCALLTACATPHREGPVTRREAQAQAPTPAPHSPILLGHYTTADGAVGLVLDRTRLPPRLKLDRSRDVVELNPVEERRGGLTYYGPDGTAVVFVDPGGSLTWSPGRDSRPLVRDLGAAPLPEATVRGQFTPPSVLEARYFAELKSYSVLERHPELSRNDAVDLAVVERILSESPSEMFFRIPTPHGTTEQSLFDRLGVDAVKMRVAEGLVWQPGAPGLAGFGVAVTLEAGVFDPGRFVSLRLEGFPPPLLEGTVVLVWATDHEYPLLVTADGGRFVLRTRSRLDTSPFVAPLVHELPPVEAWPSEVQHATLSTDAVRVAGERLGVEPGALALLAEHQKRGAACGERVLLAARRDQAKARELRRLDQTTRTAGMGPLNEKWNIRIARECWEHLRDFESTYLGVLERRKARLSELYARVRAAHAKRTASAR